MEAIRLPGILTLSAKLMAFKRKEIETILIFHQTRTLDQVSLAILHELKRCSSVYISSSQTGESVELRSYLFDQGCNVLEVSYEGSPRGNVDLNW
ncbi:hypothetical protein Tco_0152029 [Tanacetum coccineum]